MKAVLFDAWGTLFESTVTPSPFREVNNLLGTSFDNQDYMCAFEAATALDSSGDVKIIVSSLLDRIGRQVTPVAREQLEHLFRKAFTGSIRAYDDTEPVLSALRERYHLGLLSNCGILAADNLRKQMPLLSCFDAVVFSYEERRLKPTREIFNRLLDKMGGIDGADSVYVGDHWRSDYLGALEAGLCALLLDRKGRHSGKDICTIQTLAVLPETISRRQYATPLQHSEHSVILNRG